MCQQKREIQEAPETAQRLYEEGLVLMKHSHNADALSCFEKVVELDANHAEAWFRIGCCRSELLKQKIENPEEVRSVHEESEIYESAIQAYLKAIELRPNHADAQESLSELFCNYFDLQESAIEAYQKAIELQPNHADARRALAELFYVYAQQQTENPSDGAGELYNYKRAIDWCKQASKICPEMIDECYQRMAWIYTCWIDDAGYSMRECIPGGIDEFGETMCEAADGLVETYQKLARIHPNDFNAYYELGNAHRTEINLYIEFDEHLGISSNYEIAEMKQGTHPFVHENLGKAIEAYRTAVRIKPDYVDAYNALAESCQWIGQLEEAIQAFEQAIVHGNKEHSNLAKTYHQLGKKNSDNGEYTAAIEYYHNAILADSNNVEVYYDLALAYDEAGNYELAIVWYQRVRNAHANLRHDAGHYASVIDGCARMEDSYQFPDLHYRLGKAYHRISNYQDAIKSYGTAINRQIAIEEEYNRKSNFERDDFDPPVRPEWWTEVYQNHESASQNEPL